MIPSNPPRQPPALAARDVHLPRAPDDPRPAVRDWLDHLAAGRIGVAPASTPAQAARLARTEALLRRTTRAGIW